MSEFTKLGGYLIQGQPEVVHDSALSGNGLEGSPLGLSEEFITGTMRPATQSALNLNIGHPENNNVAEAGATIGSNNTAASTGLAVGFGASAFGMSIAVGENTHASNRGIAVGNGLDANGIAAFGTYNSEINTGHECIFVVGNGTDSANRSDAFKIYNDGRVEAPNFVTTNNVHLSALTGVSEANDLVHSNSGTWDEVSAKLDTSAFSDVSGTFLTGLPIDISVRDLNASRHVRATNAGQDIYGNFDFAGMYFRSGSQRPYNIGIDNTGSNFYIATAKNGFERIYASSIQNWNSKGDMFESAFSYDASNNITAYNGSAFKAGDEFPQSATEAIETVTANSADWNGTTETVSSNSGAWGGSALPISAGPGVKFEMVDNTLVASNDETVLWSGTAGTSAVTLSESFENFESIKLVHNTQVEEFMNPKSGDAVRYWHTYGTMGQGVYKMAMIHISFPDTTHITNVSAKTLQFPITGTTTAFTVNLNDTYALNTIREVIGINRIAGV